MLDFQTPHIIWPRETGFDCITNCLTDNWKKPLYIFGGTSLG